MEKHKVWDHNEYRRAYYHANPDKRLRAEEKTAASLLQRLGYTLAAPTAEAHAAAFDAIVEERRQKNKERENANRTR